MIFPTIPDSFYKLLIVLGLFLFALYYVKSDENQNRYFGTIDRIQETIDSLEFAEIKISRLADKIISASDLMSNKYRISNPIRANDSMLIFSQILSGSLKEIEVSDSLSVLWNDYKEKQFQLTLAANLINKKTRNLINLKEEYIIKEEISNSIFFIGLLLFLPGLFGMMWIQVVQDRLLKLQLNEKSKAYNYCQSCGKKYSSMRQPGKKSDGSTEYAFCKDCFDNGDFTEPNLTFKEFIERTKKENNSVKTWYGKLILKSRFNTLERWDKNDYF